MNPLELTLTLINRGCHRGTIFSGRGVAGEGGEALGLISPRGQNRKVNVLLPAAGDMGHHGASRTTLWTLYVWTVRRVNDV